MVKAFRKGVAVVDAEDRKKAERKREQDRDAESMQKRLNARAARMNR